MLNATQLKEHTLNRLGYGQGVWHANRYDQIGFAAYVDEQLSAVLPAITIDDVFIAPKVQRSVLERRGLEAVLLDFWFNHFNVNATGDKPNNRDDDPVGITLPTYQNVQIGPRVLGNFGDLLRATAESTAMMNYLDNNVNRKPAVWNDGQIVGYNENYARELMELHTLGIDGGYTETDVQEVTKILTGWSHSWTGVEPNYAFLFRNGSHDTQAKTVMGVSYPAGRYKEEGNELLAFLANHPSTASFISTKLCKRFIADNPPFRAVQAATQAFSDSGGNLQVVMESIITGPDFATADAALFRSKVKPPHRYVASALMAMGATQASQWTGIADDLTQLVINAGDTPYFFGPPTGYPETAGYWLSPASILVRFDMAEAIAYEPSLVDVLTTRIGVDGSDIAQTFDAVTAAFLPSGVSADTEAAIKDHVAANAMSTSQRVSATAHMLLCSPEFMRY